MVEESSTISSAFPSWYFYYLCTCICGESEDNLCSQSYFNGEAKVLMLVLTKPLKAMQRSTWRTNSQCVGCNERRQNKIYKQVTRTKDGEILNTRTRMLLILSIIMTMFLTLSSNVIINVYQYSHIKTYHIVVNAHQYPHLTLFQKISTKPS